MEANRVNALLHPELENTLSQPIHLLFVLTLTCLLTSERFHLACLVLLFVYIFRSNLVIFINLTLFLLTDRTDI